MTSAHDRIGCREAVAHLWDMLDGRLDEVDQRALDRHLAWCLRCCGELAFAGEVREMLQQRSTVPLPDDARRRLESFIDDLVEPIGEVP